MSDLIVACVRTGAVYSFDYVTRLRNMVARHLSLPYVFVCLTDQNDRCEGAVFVDVREIALPGWWAKMILFEPAWRGQSQIIFLDLDTVVVGELSPLAGVPHEFAILESPVRLAGGRSYPCRYNSSVMVIGAGRCTHVWSRFDKDRHNWMADHATYGDQKVIEELYPDAPILNNLMPKGFFCNYRHLTMHPPQAAVVNFGGRHKPHNCEIPWVQEAWR